VQLYVDLERPEVAEGATASFTVCGNRSTLAQNKFYSSQRSLILEFHSDTTHANNTGFRGIYRFLDKGPSVNNNGYFLGRGGGGSGLTSKLCPPPSATKTVGLQRTSIT